MDGIFHVIVEAFDVIGRVFFECAGVEIGADFVVIFGDGFRLRDFFRPFETHVFDKMGCAMYAISFIDGTDFA